MPAIVVSMVKLIVSFCPQLALSTTLRGVHLKIKFKKIHTLPVHKNSQHSDWFLSFWLELELAPGSFLFLLPHPLMVVSSLGRPEISALYIRSHCTWFTTVRAFNCHFKPPANFRVLWLVTSDSLAPVCPVLCCQRGLHVWWMDLGQIFRVIFLCKQETSM